MRGEEKKNLKSVFFQQHVRVKMLPGAVLALKKKYGRLALCC